MNILFISKHYLPHIGGVEKHIQNISKELRHKNKITVVCEQISSAKKHERLEGVEVYRIKYLHIKIVGLLYIWMWFWKNKAIIQNADLVHCHDVFIWYLPFRFLFFNKPVYSTFHGWEGKFPIPWKNILIRQISAWLSWGNICVGKYIEKYYKIKADYIIYGAVKTSNIKSKIKSNKIVFLGRLDDDTGIKIYLEAFKVIKKKYPKLKFIFLGDGRLRKEAESIGTVLGFRKDVTPYLKKSLFVCTSGYLSMLESLSLRKIVFAVSNNPLKSDTIKMSPFQKYVIHLSDSNSLARKIDYFLTNPKKINTMTLKSSHWAALQTWEQVTQTYLKLWRV